MVRTSTQVTFWRLLVDMLIGVGAAAAGIFKAESVARKSNSGSLTSTRGVMQESRGPSKDGKAINREGQNQGGGLKRVTVTAVTELFEPKRG
jgi:hypothetical protein